MGDPDREESSDDDIEPEPDSDRSDGTSGGSREGEREDEGSPGDEPTRDGDRREESTEPAEPTSYDLDEGGLFPDPETVEATMDGKAGDEDGNDEDDDEDGNDEDDDEDGEDDGKEDDDKEEEDDGEDVVNEGTSPRTRRRRLRPPREKEEEHDEDDVDGGGNEDTDDEGGEDDDVDGDEESEEDDKDGEDGEDGDDEGGDDEGGEDGDDEDGEHDEGGDDKDGEDDEVGEDEAVSNGAGAAVSQRDDGPLFEGPESDEEMPLADHIEEMMRRLAVVFAVAGIATLIAYPSADVAINYFWSSHIPDPGVNRPRVYGPLEYLLTKLKVAGIAGVIFGLPVFIYETYLFMRPGLYPRERRYYLAAIPTSVVLAAIGSLFAHFIILPAVFAYFTAYTEGTAVIAFGLQETFNLIVVLIAYMAVVFQIPLLIMLAIMMNLVTRQWLEDKRLLFWGGFLGLSWLVTPDPTGMAPIIVTLTMIGLYEGTLALLRWTGN